MNVKKLLTVLLAVTMFCSLVAISAMAKVGDANGDGTTNAKDYMLIKIYALRKIGLDDPAAFASADVNSDGMVNAKDYMLVKSHVLGKSKLEEPKTEVTAIEKLIEKIGDKKSISIHYEGKIAGQEGTATITFSVDDDGLLVLGGHAVTDKGITIDMSIPMPELSETYHFSGVASLEALSGKANGSLNAAEYSYYDDYLEDLTFSDTGSVTLTPALTTQLKGLCKEAMDEFLIQANALLIKEETDLTIADLGFTKFYQEINK